MKLKRKNDSGRLNHCTNGISFIILLNTKHDTHDKVMEMRDDTVDPFALRCVYLAPDKHIALNLQIKGMTSHSKHSRDPYIFQ